MNYISLAKRLKDAGFPQLTDRFMVFENVIASNTYVNNYNSEGKLEKMPYMPSWEELIEACGDRLYSLTKNPTGEGWIASMGPFYGNDGAFGSTPSEALAILWLKLNEGK